MGEELEKKESELRSYARNNVQLKRKVADLQRKSEYCAFYKFENFRNIFLNFVLQIMKFSISSLKVSKLSITNLKKKILQHRKY